MSHRPCRPGPSTLVLTLLAVSLVTLPTSATPTHEVRRASTPIAIDGALDEGAWESATVIELNYEVRPGENTEPPVRTVCLVTFDERHAYFGFRAYDPNPERIRARYQDRDRAWDDDWVGVVLDTFNDQRRAYELFTTPLGVQIDAVRDDVGGNFDTSWNAIWKSAGRITDDGYEVEIAVPFNQIRFQDGDGAQTWGFDAVRLYPRDQRRQFGAFPRDRGNNSYLSQAIKIVGMDGASPGKNFEIVPTVTASRTDAAATPGNSDLTQGSVDEDLGVTLRWGVTPNVSLNGAINPDFSNVEADALQLDVNQQFALFFRETRPFFLEGADYFNTGLQLVNTRNVADPSAAAKLTGKTGRHTWGVFAAQDEVTNVIVPASQGSSGGSFDMDNTSSVARYRYDFGKNSTIGGAVTDRRGSGYANTVASVDAIYRITDEDSINANFAFSTTEYNAEMQTAFGVAPGKIEDDAISVSYNHRERGWWVWVGYEALGDDFRSDLGFRPRVGYTEYQVSGAKVWWGDEGDYRNRTAWGGSVLRGEEQDGSMFVEEVASWFNFNGPRDSFFSVFTSAGDRQFAGVVFDVWDVHMDYNIQATASVGLNLAVTIEDWIDFANVEPADRLLVRPGIGTNLGRHVKLDLSHIFTELEVAGGRLFRIHAPEIRLIHQFNSRAFVRLVAQYTDILRDPSLYTSTVDAETKTLLSQLLFSYKVNPQTALYAGYTDNQLGTDAFDLTQTDRTFFLKFGYAWVR